MRSRAEEARQQEKMDAARRREAAERTRRAEEAQRDVLEASRELSMLQEKQAAIQAERELRQELVHQVLDYSVE